MRRDNLIEWQWSDYIPKHRDKTNLMIHMVAVPLFWAGLFQFLTFFLDWRRLILGPIIMILSVVLQGIGHKLEAEAPTAFEGLDDFATRFVVEQLVNFPRFVLKGEWLRSFKN